MDCGDNSCIFATTKGGQRTNGGCRCLKSIEPESKRREIVLAFSALRLRVSSLSALVTKACEALEAAKRTYHDPGCHRVCICGTDAHNVKIDRALAELHAGLEERT